MVNVGYLLRFGLYELWELFLSFELVSEKAGRTIVFLTKLYIGKCNLIANSWRKSSIGVPESSRPSSTSLGTQHTPLLSQPCTGTQWTESSRAV